MPPAATTSRPEPRRIQRPPGTGGEARQLLESPAAAAAPMREALGAADPDSRARRPWPASKPYWFACPPLSPGHPAAIGRRAALGVRMCSTSSGRSSIRRSRRRTWSSRSASLRRAPADAFHVPAHPAPTPGAAGWDEPDRPVHVFDCSCLRVASSAACGRRRTMGRGLPRHGSGRRRCRAAQRRRAARGARGRGPVGVALPPAAPWPRWHLKLRAWPPSRTPRRRAPRPCRRACPARGRLAAPSAEGQPRTASRRCAGQPRARGRRAPGAAGGRVEPAAPSAPPAPPLRLSAAGFDLIVKLRSPAAGQRRADENVPCVSAPTHGGSRGGLGAHPASRFAGSRHLGAGRRRCVAPSAVPAMCNILAISYQRPRRAPRVPVVY